MSADAALPVPELDARPITLEEYRDLTPQKLELFRGYLIAPAEDPEERRRLLALLLTNVGLLEAVTLAPEERWSARSPRRSRTRRAPTRGDQGWIR